MDKIFELLHMDLDDALTLVMIPLLICGIVIIIETLISYSV